MNLSVVAPPSLIESSKAYLNYLDEWLIDRPSKTIAEIIGSAGGVDHVAIVSVDLIVGFCHTGPLSSHRVAGILPAVREFLIRANDAGVRHIVMTQDTHRPDAEEFASYPPHCVRGTQEAQMVPELTTLPFADRFAVVEKNSISSFIEPAFAAWEEQHGPFGAFVVIGDCTDLCVYQAAMALKTRSLTNHLGQEVIVPIDCVQTYDLPVQSAQEIGAEPHDGDLLHAIFLHSMALNGVDVVAKVTG